MSLRRATIGVWANIRRALGGDSSAARGASDSGDPVVRRNARAWLNRLLGTAGERAASKHLRRHGLKILARNVRVSRRGEIDLIARDRDTLVFVEVKTRRYGDPRDAVNSEKRRRMTHAAAEFRKRYEVENVPCRFDVVAIVWPENEKRPLIEYYPNAFTAGD